jgi:hypothetical protein
MVSRILDGMKGRLPRGSGRFALIVLLGLPLAAAGGSARADSAAQAIARLAAIAVLAASVWPLDLAPLKRYRAFLAGTALAYLLLTLQLVPLPPEWWAALPGRAPYVEIVRLSGRVVWRPLSVSPDLTVNALFAMLPASAALVAALFLDMRGRIRLALALAMLASGSALLGLIQLAGGGQTLHLYDPSTGDSPVGLFANPNHHAAFLAALLPAVGASAGLRLRSGARSGTTLGAGLGAVILVMLTILLTGSRMGLLLGVVGLAGAIVTFRAAAGRINAFHHQRSRFIALGITIAAITGLAGAAVQGGATHRLAASDRLSEIRVAILPPLTKAATAFMPLGAGFGTFDPVYRRFEPDELLSTVYLNEAHDEPMQIAIEGGVPGLALLGLFLLWWARSAWRIVRWRARASRRRALAIAALTATIVLMLSSLVDYPLRTPLCGALFAIACVEMARGAAASDGVEEG